MVNNLVLGDMIGRLTAGMAQGSDTVILAAILLLCGLGALAVLLVRNRDIRKYHRRYPLDPNALLGYFTSPGTVTLILATVLTLAISLVSQMLN